MSKRWKKALGIFMAITAMSSFSACKSDNAKQADIKPKYQVVEDINGKKVEVPTELKKIAVVPIPWASVVQALDGDSTRLAAIHPSAIAAYKNSFIAGKDSKFGEVDSKLINQNFSVNMEGMLANGVEVCLMWKYQEQDAEKLGKIGVKPVLIYNDTVENLKKSFLIVGKLLGKEEKAQKLNAYYDEAYSSILKHKDEVAAAKKPIILFLRNKQLRLQGNDNFMHEALQIAGAHNPFEQTDLDLSNKNISMEDVYKINPDVILLSNFDKFVPDDLYQNKIAGQDWSSIKAVQNKHVYKVPMGLYRWDAPGVETPLMMRWLAQTLQPGIFKDIEMRKETKAFYKQVLNLDVTDADLSKVFADDANKNSVPLKP